MTKRELLARIEALEAKVALLESRPVYAPAPVFIAPPLRPQCVPDITGTAVAPAIWPHTMCTADVNGAYKGWTQTPNDVHASAVREPSVFFMNPR